MLKSIPNIKFGTILFVLKKGLLILIIALLLIFTFFVYKSSTSVKNNSVTSPLPNFLDFSKNNEVSTTDIWIPTVASSFFEKNDLPISAKSALVYDLTNDRELFDKDPKIKLPMASLTKIMTAIIGIENKKSDDKYLVSKDDLVGENTMGLSSGETLSIEELLYGLMLNSGNDAAETLASNFKGGRLAFIKAMDEKSKSLGLTDTNFTNPTGLEGDGNQYTTAYDLLVMSRYAMKYDLFRKIVSTFDYQIEATQTHKAYFLENEVNLISSYPGVKGIKDGYTPEAGLCLVTYLDYNGHQIIGVILGSENRRQEMKDLLDYSLKSEGITPPKHS